MTEQTSEKVAVYQETVVVPSKGLFYGGLLPDGKVTLRVITTKEEKILAGARNRLSAADRVLERCLIDCPIPLRDMLVTDKYFLLLYLRSISYGTEYNYQIRCGSCGTKFSQTIEILNGLMIKMADDADTEPFEVSLPTCGKKVMIRFLRGSDEEQVMRYVEQLARDQKRGDQKGGDQDEDISFEFRLSKHIVSIDGKEVNALESLAFVEEGLVGKDSLAIRKALMDRETGVSLSIVVRCPVCSFDNETALPINNEFFPASLS